MMSTRELLLRLLLVAVALVAQHPCHAAPADAVETSVCTDGATASCAAEPPSTPPPPVFETSGDHRRAVRELHDALELLNNFSHPLSPHTAGGLFSADTPRARKRMCAEARAVVVSVGGYCKQKGFGGNMWGLGEAFKYALNTDRMVVFADREKWVYVDPRDCASRSWGCYFEPVASCSEAVRDAHRGSPRFVANNSVLTLLCSSGFAAARRICFSGRQRPIDPSPNSRRQRTRTTRGLFTGTTAGSACSCARTVFCVQVTDEVMLIKARIMPLQVRT